MIKKLPLIASLLLALSGSAQSIGTESGIMHENMKVYVAVAVLSVIFLGIVIFLFSLESRLTKLEKNKH